MAEHVSNALTHGLSLGAVTIAGTLAGMPFESLILGTVAGGIMVGLTPPVPRRVGVATIATSGLLAGALAHHVADYAQAALALRSSPMAACAVLIGLGWPWAVRVVLPWAWERMQALVTRWTGG